MAGQSSLRMYDFECLGIGVRRPTMPNASNHHVEILPAGMLPHKRLMPTQAATIGSGTIAYFFEQRPGGRACAGRHARQESFSVRLTAPRAMCSIIRTTSSLERRSNVEIGRRPHCHRRHGTHGHRRLPGRVRLAHGSSARQRRHQGRRLARRHRGRGCQRGPDGLRAARPDKVRRRRARPRSAPGLPHVGALHDRQQDVRLGHEDGDDGLRRPARPRQRHHRRRRHGKHDQFALPAAEDAQRRPPRPRRGEGPHVPRRPGGCLRQGPADGHVRGGYRAALSVHARGAGRIRRREPQALQGGQRGRLLRQGDRRRLRSRPGPAPPRWRATSSPSRPMRPRSPS